MSYPLRYPRQNEFLYSGKTCFDFFFNRRCEGLLLLRSAKGGMGSLSFAGERRRPDGSDFRLLRPAKGGRFRFSSRCAFLAQRDALGIHASLGAEPSALRLAFGVGAFVFLYSEDDLPAK
jgi:hypothetical protein